DRIVSEDSYQSVLQVSSAAPHAPRPSAQPAPPPHAPLAQAHRPASSDAVKTLHVLIRYV
ncbi:hypothetical protein A2U01_0103671, partial [Trifolium medium]|nr:hypothetical protein [Trifolium medium]